MLLTGDELLHQIAALQNWEFDGKQIYRNFVFTNFEENLKFVNAVAVVAEAMQHHPDIFIHSWNKLRIAVWTHDAGGITSKDIALATKIDLIQ